MSLAGIHYSFLVREAMLGMIRKVLMIVADSGLSPDAHMLCISFTTQFQGVSLPEYLLARYPREIEIVLQHEFHNLEVTASEFAVTLAFDGNKEHIVVPFAAITGFRDLLADFDIRLETSEEDEGLAHDGATIRVNNSLDSESSSEEKNKKASKSSSKSKVRPGTDPKIIDMGKFRKK